jgi:hypothetical protein
MGRDRASDRYFFVHLSAGEDERWDAEASCIVGNASVCGHCSFQSAVYDEQGADGQSGAIGSRRRLSAFVQLLD